MEDEEEEVRREGEREGEVKMEGAEGEVKMEVRMEDAEGEVKKRVKMEDVEGEIGAARHSKDGRMWTSLMTVSLPHSDSTQGALQVSSLQYTWGSPLRVKFFLFFMICQS